MRRPIVAGWGQTEIGRHPEQTPTELATGVLYEALEYSKLNIRELEGVLTVPQGYMRARVPMYAQRLAEQIGVPVRSLAEVGNGGTSAMLAFKMACMEIACGNLDVVAVVGAQAERALFGEELTPEVTDRVQLINAMYGSQLGPYGMLMALPSYALSAQRYMYEHDVDERDIAELPVRLRYNATLNKQAEQREPITVDQVLESPLVSPPIHRLEAPPWSDGAACVILMSEDRAWRSDHNGPAVVGWGEAHEPENFVPFGSSLTDFPWMRRATDEALGRAGRTRDSVDVAEVYGAFAHAELVTYESMGFFRPGEAAEAVKRGDTAINGQLPINTSGGRLSLGHPPQATPLLMVAEIARQLTGRAGKRQVRSCKLGLVQTEHGMMNGGVVCALEN